MSSEEAYDILVHAPEKGYITRYSDRKDKFVLSVAFPTTKGQNEIKSFVLAIDDDVPSYALKGGGKTFQSVEEMLLYYEKNKVSTNGSFGVSYSQMDTTMWQIENNLKKTKEPEEQEKLRKQQENEKPGAENEGETPKELQQCLKDLTEQQKACQDQIQELQKANKELLDALQRRHRNHVTCNTQ